MKKKGKTPFILFITGISGSGKTTLYKSLKKDNSLRGIKICDIDENGTPKVGRSAWGNFRVEEMLYEATKQYEKGKSTIICGLSEPHKIIESRYYNSKQNIHFIMLDISLKKFKQRIKKRIPKKKKEDNFDETFNPDNYQELVIATKHLQRRLKNTFANLKNGYVLKLGEKGKKEMHGAVSDTIKKIISKST